MAKIGEISLENIKEQAREILKIPKSRFQKDLGLKFLKVNYFILVQDICLRRLFKTFVRDVCSRRLFETFVREVCSRRLFETFVRETFVRDVCLRCLFEMFV